MRNRLLWATVGAITAACLAVPARADIINCTIADIQDTSSAMRDTLVAADTVRVIGVITGTDTEATGFGFYIEDGSLAAAYRGVLVFTGGNNTVVDSALALGDQVRVTGRLAEFEGGTEVVHQGSGSPFSNPPPRVEKLGTAAIPGPTSVSPSDIVRNGLLSEQYEGMFCLLNTTMKVGTSWPTDPRLSANFMLCVADPAGTDTVMVDMTTLIEPPIVPPGPGAVITFMRGILEQRSGGHRLQIRNSGDITLPTPPNVTNAMAVSDDTIRVVFDRPMDEATCEDAGNYSRGTLKSVDAAILQVGGQAVHLACTSEPQVSPELEEVFVQNVKSAAGATMTGIQSDEFIAGITPITELQAPDAGEEYVGALGTDTTQFLTQMVTVRGTVTARFGSLLWVQDPAGGLRSGFKFFAPSGPMAVGDDVTIAGVAIEFFDETEISGSAFERNHGPGVLPAPLIPSSLSIMNADLGPPAREDFEHVLIRIENIAVLDEDVGFFEYVVVPGSEFMTPGTPETLHVDDRGFSSHGYQAENGDQFTAIIGPCEISFGSTKIEPRTSADLIMGPVTGAPEPGLVFALHTPQPNPASLERGGAEISFTLPREGAAQVRLYDLRGRLVRELTDGRTLDPGPHSVRWDGRDAGGARVGAGIYFVQLKLGNAVAATKVVVAE